MEMPAFTEFSYTCIVVFGLVREFSALMSALLSILMSASRINLNKDCSMLLTLNLTVIDTIYNGVLSAGFLLKWINNSPLPYGKIGCNIEGFFHVAGTLLSINALLWIGLERYYLVVRSNRRKLKYYIIGVVFVWTVSIFLGLSPFLLPDGGYLLHLQGTYCVTDWGSCSPDKLIVAVVLAGALGGTSDAIGYIYYSIYDHIRSIQKECVNAQTLHFSSSQLSVIPSDIKLTSILTTNPNIVDKFNQISTTFNQPSKLNRMVFIKGFMLTAAVLIAWTPYTLLIVMSLIGVSIPSEFEVFSCGFAMLYTYLNCISIVVLNSRIKGLALNKIRLIRTKLHLIPTTIEKFSKL